MEEEIVGIVDPGCYLESLVKNRFFLVGMEAKELIVKLDEVINAELDLALMAAQKAKSELLKKGKDNVKPINPGAA